MQNLPRKSAKTKTHTISLLLAMLGMLAYAVWSEWELVSAHFTHLFGLGVMAAMVGGLFALALHGE
jgi:hypothetical protein